MKKQITKRGYRILAVVWTLAAASIAAAFARRLAQFSLPLLLLLVVSLFTAASFWKAFHAAQEQAPPDPFAHPPKFADNPALFEDAPVKNQDSEEKTHE